MRVEQFALYREDVRDLVELTVGKMDLYLIAAALLVDRTIVMICKQNEAFPSWSPEWAVTLNGMSLASGVFYLLLCLWLALYASISAQSFGARILTQFVRIPFATPEQLARVTRTAQDFEGQNTDNLLRVPIIGASPGQGLTRISEVTSGRPTATTAGRPTAATEPARDSTATGIVDTSGWNLLPLEMLQHIQLYRRVQLNWQAYDAYARVCLFLGASSLLYSCLYWSLGQFLQLARAPVPALGVGIIFASCQMLLCKLDLRMNRTDTFWICLLLALTPIFTTWGLLLHQENIASKGELAPIWHLAMSLCGVFAHLLHALVAIFTLWSAWPDTVNDQGALLPNRFKSSLYLDVFGWLLNTASQPLSGGPPAVRAIRRVTRLVSSSIRRSTTSGSISFADEADSHRSSEMLRTGSTLHGSTNIMSLALPECDEEALNSAPTAASNSMYVQRRVERSALALPTSRPPTPRNTPDDTSPDAVMREPSIEVNPGPSLARQVSHTSQVSSISVSEDLQREFARFFPQSLMPTQPQESNFGGHEAVSLVQMLGSTLPHTAAPSTFAPAPPTSISDKVDQPGEIPWSAFKHGTVVIISLWILTTLQVVLSVVMGWEVTKQADDPHQEGTNASRPDLLLARSSCRVLAGRHGPSDVMLGSVQNTWQQVLASAGGIVAGQLEEALGSRRLLSAEGACSLSRPLRDVSLACRAAGSSRQCVAALLDRGGQEVTLCRLSRRGASLVARRWAVLRLPPGRPPLVALAAGWPLARGSGHSRLGGLRVYGRDTAGALLTFRGVSRRDGQGGSSPCSLVPELELEPPSRAGVSEVSSTSLGLLDGTLAPLEEEHLFSVGPLLLSLRARGFSEEACSSRGCSVGAAARGRLSVLGDVEVRAWDFVSGRRVHWRERSADERTSGLLAAAAAGGPWARVVLEALCRAGGDPSEAT